MKKLVLLLISLILVALVSCDVFSEKEQSNTVYIVTIGNDYLNHPKQNVKEFITSFANPTKYRYLGSLERGINPLVCCTEDAKDISDCLSAIYTKKNVTYVTYSISSDTNLKPTPVTLKSVLTSINPKKDDLIVLYYSGHGVREDETSYFCLNKDDNDGLAFLPVNEVLAYLSTKPCLSFAIIDACEIGSSYNQDSLSNPSSMFDTLFNKFNFSNVCVLASSSSSQTSYGGSPNSIYTAKLLQCLGWDIEDDILVSTPNFMTSRQLYDASLVNWKKTSQSPEINFTQLDLVVVPEAR